MTYHSGASSGWVDGLVREYRHGRPVVFLFDYDGTLTPIVRHPSLAFLPATTRELLAGLTSLPDVSAAVLSGRGLDEVKSRVGLEDLYFAGSGGLEIDLRGDRRGYPGCAEFEHTLNAVHEHLLDPLRSFPGTWVERKPAALAIHFRGLLPLNAVCFRLEVCNRLAALDGVRFRVVSEAIEVTPFGGWDKGTAVEAILEHERARHPSPLPVYFGDAPNDAEGMIATLKGGGVPVGIGPDAPEIATVRLADPEALVNALTTLRRELAAARGIAVTPTPGLPPGPANDARGDGDENGDQPLVVVIDPDPDHRRRAGQALRQLGWRVWSFSTPTDAEEVLDRHAAQVRALLVDLEQPGLTGGRLLANWGQTRPNVVRCGMARVSPYMSAVFRRMSGIPLLAKPLDAQESNRQLRSLLKSQDTAV
ncbi:MAG: trehalose-phosphatase [Fimbriiglobus sp.]|nr:trehalose-phosphatase [Fimbriiglobus sp.]